MRHKIGQYCLDLKNAPPEREREISFLPLGIRSATFLLFGRKKEKRAKKKNCGILYKGKGEKEKKKKKSKRSAPPES